MKFKTIPFEYQKSVIEEAVKCRSYGLFHEQGLGKTKTAIDIVVNKYIKGEIKKAWILCPAGLITNWEVEINTHCLPEYIHIFKHEGNTWEVISKRTDYTLISHGLLSKYNMLPYYNKETFIIIDESHNFKNPEALRSDTLLAAIEKSYYYGFLSLSGTPESNTIIDLFIQAKLLGIFDKDYTLKEFKKSFCQYELTQIGSKKFNQYIDKKNYDYLLELFKTNSSWLRKENVINLPEKQYIPMYYSLNSKQIKLINNLRENIFTLKEDLDDETENIITRSVTTMSQIYNGFVYNPDGSYLDLKGNKIELLFDLVESLGNKPIIIFCAFRHELDAIHKKLKNRFNVSIRHGKLNSVEKQIAVDDFKSNKTQILLATTKSTREGLTLTNCNTIIYFSNTFDLIDRLQSEDRIHRIGQNSNCIYYDLIANNSESYDKHILELLNNKSINLKNLFNLLKKY